jgi:hypothetical protein
VNEGRILVVTVGTSLFASASWKCEGKLKTIRGYSDWIRDFLEDPTERRNMTGTSKALEKLLVDAGAEITSKYFDVDFDRPKRYSGELTTLLRCSQNFRRPEESFAEFLHRSYREIQLLGSTNHNNPSYVAASHLQIILQEKVGHPHVTMPGSLRSPYLHELIGFFHTHLNDLAASGIEVDLLVTGGYKAFSLLAGKFVARQPQERRWRALYIHEEAVDHLIVETKDAAEIDGHTVAEESWSEGLVRRR